MKDIIVTAMAVVLSVIVIIFLNNEVSRMQQLKRINSELEIKTSTYYQEMKQLQDELEELKAQKLEKEKGVGSLILVFYDINEDFFEKIVPELDEKGCVATLCITKKNLLGNGNLLSVAYIEDLVSRGWEISLYWDGTEEFHSWYADISNLLTATGLAVPKLLTLDSASYNISLDDDFASTGFNTLIFAINGKNYIEDNDSRFNKINGHPWYTTESSTSLYSVDFYNSQLAFFIGTEGEELAYESNQFSSMLKSALDKQEDGKVVITTPIGSLEQIAKNKEIYEKTLEGYDNRIAEIENAIAKVEFQIDSVYDEYNK